MYDIMENKEREIDLIELLRAVWVQKWKLCKWGVGGLVAGIIIAFSIPTEYKTVVQIAPEGTVKEGQGQMSGIAAMMGVNIGGAATAGVTEKIYPEIVKSTPFLLEFANIEVQNKDKEKMSLFDYLSEEQKAAWWSYVISAPMYTIGWVRGLFSADTPPKGVADSIDIFNLSEELRSFATNLSSRIIVEDDKKTSIYKVSAKMQDPLISAVVADSLVSKLQRYMTAYRTSKARADLAMNQKMLDEAQQQYYAADEIYATYVDKNQNLIMQSARVKVERLKNERDLAFSVYQQLATQVEMSKVKLQEETIIATIIEPASVPLIPDSPNKKLIAIAFTFLAVFTAAGIVVVKFLIARPKEIGLIAKK